jgi:RNA-binding protein YhbY
MKNTFQAKFQIGKQGITEGVINSLNQDIKTHRQVRISVLKSATRNREELKQIVETLKTKIKTKCSYRTIGYTIIIIKT